jgi:hypothetical protein
MAAYPSYRCTADSTAEPEAGIDAERATNGLLRVRALYPADKTTFEVRHILTNAERDALWAFYLANKLLDVTFRWQGDGQTYTVRFGAAPRFRRRWPLHHEATVRLLEV